MSGIQGLRVKRGEKGRVWKSEGKVAGKIRVIKTINRVLMSIRKVLRGRVEEGWNMFFLTKQLPNGETSPIPLSLQIVSGLVARMLVPN